MTKPGNVKLFEIAHAPNISSRNEGEEMEGAQSLTIPVQVWKEEEIIFFLFLFGAEEDVLLLLAAFNDVENPVQSSFVTTELHVWTHVFRVYFRRLNHDTGLLEAVFLNVLRRARVDEVDFQVWRRSARGIAGICKVPAVDVIVAEVFNVGN